MKALGNRGGYQSILNSNHQVVIATSIQMQKYKTSDDFVLSPDLVWSKEPCNPNVQMNPKMMQNSQSGTTGTPSIASIMTISSRLRIVNCFSLISTSGKSFNSGQLPLLPEPRLGLLLTEKNGQVHPERSNKHFNCFGKPGLIRLDRQCNPALPRKIPPQEFSQIEKF